MVGKTADGKTALTQNGVCKQLAYLFLTFPLRSWRSTGLLTPSQGLLETELIRDDELEKQGQNPWRISKYKVIKKWDRGDDTVLDLAKSN